MNTGRGKNPTRPECVMVVQKAGDSQVVKLRFKNDYNAEQVLRGLYHDGYTVTVKEEQVELTDEEMRRTGLYPNLPEAAPPTRIGQDDRCDRAD